MKKITYIVDIERESVRTIGATHAMKGNVDGNINFFEAGIDGLTDKDDIIEALEEMNDCLPEQEKVDEIIVKFV